MPGRDISLTVDVELLESIERAMRGQLAGAIAVVDVRTGRLLAALSKPSFDPNVVSGSMGRPAIMDAFRRMYKDPLKPLLDKTISAAYPPGSTYKPFSALAGLDEHLISPQTQVDCRGGYEFGRRYFRCTGVHRNVNLHASIVQSCNTYYYALGELIHIDRLSKIGMDFGFGVKTGIGVNPESPGRMPTRAWYSRRYKGEGFRGGFTLLSAIGQGASTVTVLQLALSYAALANGGTLYQPQVVRSIETSDGTIVQDFPPRVRRIVDIPPERLKLVRMRFVASSKNVKARHTRKPLLASISQVRLVRRRSVTSHREVSIPRRCGTSIAITRGLLATLRRRRRKLRLWSWLNTAAVVVRTPCPSRCASFKIGNK